MTGVLLGQEFLGEFAESLHSCTDEEFLVETVGVLGNLSIPNLDFERLFRQFQLVDWVKSKLSSGECEQRRRPDTAALS